jgi:PAS domain S-box-containing protein
MPVSSIKSARTNSWNILAAIVDSSDDAIISKDLNGNITSWNTSAERLFGYRADEVIGRSIMLLIPPELQQDEIQILRKIKAGERIDHFQTVRMKKNGERMEVSLTISPVKDEQGTIVGAAKINVFGGIVEHTITGVPNPQGGAFSPETHKLFVASAKGKVYRVFRPYLYRRF